MKTYVASHLKDMNRKTVYNLLSSVGEISKTEISRITEISQPTVNKIVSFFIQNNIVTEAGEGEGESSLGRKPQIMRFNSEAFYSIGIDFEGDFIEIGLVDLAGNIILLKQYHVVPDFNDIMGNRLPDFIEDIIKDAAIPKEKILGVGIGIPGVVDTLNNTVEFAPLVGITSKQDCGALLNVLSTRTGLAIYFENDANMAAIGEFDCRRLKSDDDLIYINIGTGLGAGIILDGKIRRGKHYYAGEIGYMVFDKNFEAKMTQPGWMENWINIRALSLRWGFFDNHQPELETDQIVRPQEQNVMIDYVASNLALCIANMITLVDVNQVVIGGIVENAIGANLIEKINEYLSHLCLSNVRCEAKICPEPTIVGSSSIIRNIKLEKILFS